MVIKLKCATKGCKYEGKLVSVMVAELNARLDATDPEECPCCHKKRAVAETSAPSRNFRSRAPSRHKPRRKTKRVNRRRSTRA